MLQREIRRNPRAASLEYAYSLNSRGARVDIPLIAAPSWAATLPPCPARR